MEKGEVARILAEAYHKDKTWEQLSNEEQAKWFNSVNALEVAVERLPVEV